MNFDHRHYVPCLHWKQGEYQAILNLTSSTKAFITPLIEVPEIGFDFESWEMKKSLNEHLAPFATRVLKKWQGRPCFVDIHPRLIDPSLRMDNGQHPLKFLFERLRILRCVAIPVTGLNRDKSYQRTVQRIVSQDGRGLCLRISIEDAAKSSNENTLNAFFTEIGISVRECDLILDLGAPNFQPIEGFAKVVEAIARNLPFLSRWRTFAIIGTSFPSSMAEVKESPTTIPRYEWLLYKKIVKSLAKAGVRVPSFGDYAINHPDVNQLDMRTIKPSATIRYAADDSWFIVKGSNVRDNGFDQYREHCQTVTASYHYLGPRFSYGDKYIADCASGVAKTGNLSTWRMVGTNRHLEKVVSDISSLFGSSDTP